MEKSTQEETSSKGEFQAKWAEGAHAYIPLSVWWGDMKPSSKSFKNWVGSIEVFFVSWIITLLRGSIVFSSRRISVSQILRSAEKC